MDSLTTDILRRIVWESIKKIGKVATNYLKNGLREWILDEEDYKKIAKEINNAPDSLKKTEKFLDDFLDDNETIE
ncbi:hypothetical protein [Halonatronum saccharophilum]|uniref:hypothetical protein n=1 Tax=Halonatronum saccharophilum TaxID=150060 RepID=UPI000488BE1D|nr:hypothetical protein [Halonatronum saccharophilum]